MIDNYQIINYYYEYWDILKEVKKGETTNFVIKIIMNNEQLNVDWKNCLTSHRSH